MPRVSESQVDRSRVQAWAAWRREGKSYDEIEQLDTLGPSYPTIKRYLEKYGFEGDGNPAENGSEPSPDHWGEIETGVRLPGPGSTSKYDEMLDKAINALSEKWARIPAPSVGAARYFGEKLRRAHDCEIAVRTVDEQPYIYFRAKKNRIEAG